MLRGAAHMSSSRRLKVRQAWDFIHQATMAQSFSPRSGFASVDAVRGRPWLLPCPNRTSHTPGVPTLELVLPSRVAEMLAAAHANRAMAVPVWRCIRYLG